MKSRFIAFPLPLFIAAVVGIMGYLIPYPPVIRDLVRAIIIIEAVVIIGITTSIARRYYHNYRVAPGKARLLPRHVSRLGIGVTLLCISSVGVMIQRVEEGSPFHWFGAPIILPAVTTLMLGLIDMIQWLPDRTAPSTHRGRRSTDFGHNEDVEI